MPQCPTHGVELLRVKTTVRIVGKGFERSQRHFEELLCPVQGCGYRIGIAYLILDIGQVKGSRYFPKWGDD